MKVLVTGGAGFIGSAIVRDLLEAGHEVHVVTRPPGNLRRIETEAVQVHVIDLLDSESLGSCVGSLHPDWVVHTAAEPGHPTTPEQTLNAWQGTTLGTVSLLEALNWHRPTRLVHLGSALEYAPSSQPHKESSRLGPVNTRGLTKLAAAQAVTAWSQETGIPSTNLRIFAVYGRSEQSHRLVPTLLRALRDDTEFRLPERISRRDFIDVDDVARAVSMVLQTSHHEPVLNIGTGIENSVQELARTAESVTGKTLLVADRDFPPSPADRTHLVADVSLALKALGWSAQIPLEEGLAAEWDRIS